MLHPTLILHSTPSELAIILSYFSINMPPAIGGFLFSLPLLDLVRLWRTPDEQLSKFLF
jgi:hypothetical protein